MAVTKIMYVSKGAKLACGKKSKEHFVEGGSKPITAEDADWTKEHVAALVAGGHLRKATAEDFETEVKEDGAKGKKDDNPLACFCLDAKKLKGKSVENLQLIAATIAGDNKLDELDDFQIPQFKTEAEGIKFLTSAGK